ncbi:hypothetical protein JCM31271_34330 [Halorubrum trueperi]
MYYPYRKDDYLTYGAYAPTIEFLAMNGYNVITADLVGTGASSGRKERPFDSSTEGREGKAIVEWLADQEWTTGRIGMFGKSYPGMTCLSTAAARPDGLEAIAPMYTSTGGFNERHGGLLDAWGRGGHWNPQMQALQALPSSNRDDDGRWEEVWKEHLQERLEGTPWLFQALDHEYEDEYWKGTGIDVSRIEVPTFAVSGWRDIAPRDTLDYVSKIDAPKRAILGPWRHTLPHRGRETAIEFRPQLLEWFDYFLKNEENDALSHPTITFWTERDGGGKIDRGVWRATETWPKATDDNVDALTFAVTPSGLQHTDEFTSGSVEIEYEHDHTVGMYSQDEFAVPADTNGDDVRSLCFETDSLDDAVELTGNGTVDLRLMSSIPDPLVSVRIVDVSPNGDAMLITHRRLRASHRFGHDSRQEVTPGEEFDIQLYLKPKSHVFEEGHKIRLAISGAHFPVALPTRKQGTFRLHSDPKRPSLLTLPGRVHESKVAFDETLDMGQPDTSVLPVDSQYVTPERSMWETTREHINDTASVHTYSGKKVELPHAESMTFNQDIRASVEANDPSSMFVYSETEMTISHRNQRAHAWVTCRTSRDSTQISTTVTLDEQTVFEETWTR